MADSKPESSTRLNSTRRRFLAATACGSLAAGGLAAGPLRCWPLPTAGSVLGANERVRLGFIGVGWKGRHTMNVCKSFRDRVEIVGFADVYGGSLAKALEMANVDERRVRTHHDFRSLLDQREIDAVVVSTPDHWHGLAMMHSCAAGKDVYVEKPLSYRLLEGRRMVQAARRYGRVVQVGTQQRAGNKKDGLFFRAADIVRSGEIGEVSLVKCWNDNNLFPGIGNPPDQAPPPDLDWNFWLGPAPKRPFNPNRFIHSFRWFWDYSGGKATDWGTHWIDAVQWAMDGQPPGGTDTDNVGALPVAVSAHGRKFVLEDNRDTPDTLQATVEYPKFVMTYENRVCNNRQRHGEDHGIEFYGRKGTLFVNRSYLSVGPQGGTGEPLPIARRIHSQHNQFVEHFGNFLDCIESREKPASDVEIGHRSTSTAHLINIALKCREIIHWDARNERITNSRKANAMLEPNYRSPWQLPL